MSLPKTHAYLDALIQRAIDSGHDPALLLNVTQPTVSRLRTGKIKKITRYITILEKLLPSDIAGHQDLYPLVDNLVRAAIKAPNGAELLSALAIFLHKNA